MAEPSPHRSGLRWWEALSLFLSLSPSPLVDVCSPKAVESLELNVSLSSVGGWVFWAGRQAGGQGGTPLVLWWWRRKRRKGSVCLPLSRLTARQGDVAQMEDGEWVSLCVEDPTLQRHQVVAGEQQVEIPDGAGRRVRGTGGIHKGVRAERLGKEGFASQNCKSFVQIIHTVHMEDSKSGFLLLTSISVFDACLTQSCGVALM